MSSVAATPQPKSAPSGGKSAGPRLQARAAATRERLLDATVEALVAVGYAGTTTQEVCRRAGCSRGTLLYHFPKREDLVVAALGHVLTDRVERFVAEHRGALSDVDDFLAAMWQQWQGPALIAWLELAVASRTNPSLRVAMAETMADFDAQILAAFRALNPVGELPASLEAPVLHMTFAVLNGLAVSQAYDDDGPAPEVLGLLSTIARAATSLEAPR